MTTYNSLFEAIEAGLRRRSEDPAILWAGEAYSGLDVLRRVNPWAAALSDSGICAGDRLIVQAHNSLQLVLLYLAALKIGAVYVPLNTAYTSTEVGYFLDDCKPTMFVCDPAVEEEYADRFNRSSMTIRSLGADGEGTFSDAVKDRGFVSPSAALTPDDLAAIVYTSGTTGRSKGAMISNRNLLANAAALIESWEIGSEDVLLHALPLFHIHGLFVALNTSLMAGACVDLQRGFDVDFVLKSLPRATLFMGVPTQYTRLLSDRRFDQSVTKRVRALISGSAPLSTKTFQEVQDRTGHTILERYGMTECGIICSNSLRGERIPGAVGKPLPGVAVRLAANSPSSEPEEVGVLEVSGPSVFTGYWQMPERTAAEFRTDGYFMTGDLVTIDEHGVVRIVGRDKDLIISGGLNVYAKEVETLIERYSGVCEAAVIGLPHPDFGEAVAAVISMMPGAPRLNEQELIASLRRDLAPFKVPKVVFHVDELPRNTMGKIQKASLRECYSEAFHASAS